MADALQITLSWFLCTLLIICWLPVLMLNIDLFTFSSRKRSSSQVFVTRLPRWSYMATLYSSISFLFEEVMPLFEADTCALLPLVGKRVSPPANPYSFWLACWTPVMIWEIKMFFNPFQHLQSWWWASFYLPGTLCVTGFQWSFSLYGLRVRPTLNLQSNGWHLRY